MRGIFFFREIFKQFPFLIICNMLTLIIIGLFDAISVISLAPVVDLLIKQDMKNTSSISQKIIETMGYFGINATLGKLLFVFLIINIMRSFLYVFFRYLIFKTKYYVIRRILHETFEDFFNARWQFFINNAQGTLLNTFMREVALVGEAFAGMANFFAQIIQCLLFLSIPFFLSWQVTSIGLFFAILFALPLLFLGKFSYQLGKMNTLTANYVGSIIQESLCSAKVILGFGNQHQSLSSLARAFDAHLKAMLKSHVLGVINANLYYPFGVLVLIIVILSGQIFTIPLSEVIVILYSYFRITPLLGGLPAQKNSLNNFYPSYEQIMNLRRDAQQLKQKLSAKVFLGFDHEIAIEGLSFAYPGHHAVLIDINVRIPKGKMVAFVGKSGAGKSTLIDMIMGFHEPLTGRITVDDVSLQDFDIISYRRKIGYVPQDSILFNMTIRDNLHWAKESATEEEIKSACLQANAAEFIEGFPNGYDTIVGDRGVRLSGGQIQRIALARAILRNPDILILDEATSSLDTQSERLIQQAVEIISKKTTVIVIAHRLSTIVNADYIYVLDKGRVVEEGTYAQLIRKGEFFSKMIKMQHLDPVSAYKT